MPKAQKLEAVERLKGEFRESQAALLTSFRGLKVAEMTELRRSLAASQTDFKVVKNTLARIAAKDIGLEDLLPLLEGSTAVAFVKGDPVTAAKGLDEISRKYPALVLKGGVLTGRVLSAERAAALAHVGESHLDSRLIEKNLAVHPDFDCSGKVRLRCNHDFEEHPLRDRNGNRGVVYPRAGFSGVWTFSRSRAVGTPDQLQHGV